MKKIALVIVLLTALLAGPSGLAEAKTILFIPADTRPVSFGYVVDTARAAGVELIVPPDHLLGSRTSLGNPEALWEWALDRCPEADAIVVSGDALLYGSLVGSREHGFSNDILQQRAARFAAFKQRNPSAPVYVYSTIMRTPKFSAGGVEPDYYEKYGPSIFQITALDDKSDLEPLTGAEQAQLQTLTAAVPKEAMTAWLARRAQNYDMNVSLVGHVKNNTFNYLIVGRDDSSPFSASHKESRLLAQVAQGLPVSRYASFPGADQLGMLLVTRAINDFNWQLPVVLVNYAPGAGPRTVPSYEDAELGQTIPAQIAAAGGVMLDNAVRPDLVLAVNTPENGKTLEANSPANQGEGRPESGKFAAWIDTALTAGAPVAVANIAFSNGADNRFMAELDRRHLLPRLAALSGWNTASNTLGYAIGQGMLAAGMSVEAKNRLLAVRLLDDWAYQANIRGKISAEVLWPAGGDYFYLNDLAPRITAETRRELQDFAKTNLEDFDIRNLQVSFPWNRMFEVQIGL